MRLRLVQVSRLKYWDTWLLRGLFLLMAGLSLFWMQPKAYAEAAPGFNLPGIGGPVQLDQLRGKAVYLDFWASWCPPCRRSFPWMAQMQERYGEKGLQIIAVNMDGDKTLADEFLAEQKINFLVAFDPAGDVANAYKVRGLPVSYLIDRNGNLVGSHAGFFVSKTADYENAIKALLNVN